MPSTIKQSPVVRESLELRLRAAFNCMVKALPRERPIKDASDKHVSIFSMLIRGVIQNADCADPAKGPLAMESKSQTWAIRPPPSVSSRSSFTSRLSTTVRRTLTRNHHNSELEPGTTNWASTSTYDISTSQTFATTSRSKRKESGGLYRNGSTKPTFQWARGELIGQGSYGRVYLALNATTGEIIAVKQVEVTKTHSDRRRQTDVAQALRLEKNTLKHLDHTHIVRFLGYEENSKCLSIFMEYVSGGTIRSCLTRHGAFEHETTKHFMTQILEGLSYLHGRGVIHRDLKGDNILVETSGVCKISDFGISKQGDDIDGRAFTEMRGTVNWMAPEVLERREGGYDSKVDIWSIGCVLLEMWTAKSPWEGQALFTLLLKVAREKLPPPLPLDIKLSDEALDFRRQCFIDDPISRRSAAELLSHPYLLDKRPDWSFRFPEAPPSSKGQNVTSHSHRTVRSGRASHRPSSTRQETPPATLRPPPRHPAPPPMIPVEGPPIVYITPPGSPVKDSPGDFAFDMLSSASASTSDSGTAKGPKRRRRSFFVANPNPEDGGSSKKSYVYTPPPLPTVSRHSTRHSASNTPGRSSLHPSVVRSVKSMSSMHPTFDSDEETDFGFWKKPPANLPSVDQRQRHSRAGVVDSALDRPVMEDIVDNLQDWFPAYDIDKPIIQEMDQDLSASPNDPSRARRINRGKKSIRKVAEERAMRSNRLQRRGTKLWGSSIQELQMD
ncbi:mitogen-activated protein kinase kinase kinase [Marasmius crinis-equi]|uniref:Mitogen-activated protein kinase kinase kinase n=1 Tax=Marasmius crinis-equi TaxID=585013 RepID=A0ABR3FU49_9AGAR